MSDEPTDITHLLDEQNSPPRRSEPGESGRILHGRCVAYREDGSLLLEITYNDGVANGPYRDYWSSGRIALEGQFVDGEQDGVWKSYDRDSGAVRQVLQFSEGRELIR